jgi:hypothetical protein
MKFIEVLDTKGNAHFINVAHIEEVKINEYNSSQTIIQIPYKQILADEEYNNVKNMIRES